VSSWNTSKSTDLKVMREPGVASVKFRPPLRTSTVPPCNIAGVLYECKTNSKAALRRQMCGAWVDERFFAAWLNAALILSIPINSRLRQIMISQAGTASNNVILPAPCQACV
jgi:hypothetical protein